MFVYIIESYNKTEKQAKPQYITNLMNMAKVGFVLYMPCLVSLYMCHKYAYIPHLPHMNSVL